MRNEIKTRIVISDCFWAELTINIECRSSSWHLITLDSDEEEVWANAHPATIHALLLATQNSEKAHVVGDKKPGV